MLDVRSSFFSKFAFALVAFVSVSIGEVGAATTAPPIEYSIGPDGVRMGASSQVKVTAVQTSSDASQSYSIINMGVVPVGVTSQPINFTLNIGGPVGAYASMSVRFEGSSAFSVINNQCVSVLVPGQCRYSVVFSPQAPGSVSAIMHNVLNYSNDYTVDSAVFEFIGVGFQQGQPYPPQILSVLSNGVTLSSDGTIRDSFGNLLAIFGTPEDTSEPYCLECGEPVNLATGSMWHKIKDFDVPGRTRFTHLLLERTYLSHPVLADSDFGPHWFSNWETQILSASGSSNPDLIWIDPSGGPFTFKRNADNTFRNPAGFFGTLLETTDHYEIDLPHGVKYLFSRNASIAPIGRLTSIIEPHGEAVQLIYDGNGKLSRAQTGLAGSIAYQRDNNGHVIRVQRVRDSLSYSYSYNAGGLLSSSSDFDSNTTTYSYQSVGTATGFLSEIIDPIGRKVDFKYDSQARASSQTVRGGGVLSFQYSSNSTGPVTTLKDIDGQTSTYQFNSLGLLVAT